MDLPAIARTAAERAAEWIRSVPAPGPADEWDVKGHHDFVTEVDRTAEAMITEELLAAEPGSQVIGEELRPELATRGLVWIVDPLDGTTNFLHGYPQYAVSIAAAVDGDLVAAAVTHVPLGITYQAGRGRGAWFGDHRLSVSHTSAPSHALIGTGFPFKHLHHMEEYQRQFAAVMRSTSGVRRAGSAALDLADVAAGRFDAFWELMLAPWDTAAGILLVREAGGVVTDLEGRNAGIVHSGIVAGNPAMQAWLLEVVRG
jgi:myo-inositol-1(or 4)-monophosphatase